MRVKMDPILLGSFAAAVAGAVARISSLEVGNDS